MGGKVINTLKRKLLIKVMVVMLPLLLLIIITSSATIILINEQKSRDNSDVNTGNLNLSPQVLAWKPEVEKYAKQFGVSQYEDLILAVIEQESGGVAVDVMQSSQCGYNTEYPNGPNGITDPDYSIYCGIQELKEDITKSGAINPSDIQGISLALQAYNFGEGFIDFAKARGGYSLEVAQAFSNMEGSNYGDINYVPHVFQYYVTGDNSGDCSAKLSSVVQIAEREEGKDYVYGTAGPDTFDCSGLVYYCYEQAGFKIQRQTAQDYYNESIKTNTPAIGDLVFFGDPTNIYHIGIYIGNNEMIDAPKSNDVVKIQSYNWSDFAGFGRYKEN